MKRYGLIISCIISLLGILIYSGIQLTNTFSNSANSAIVIYNGQNNETLIEEKLSMLSHLENVSLFISKMNDSLTNKYKLFNLDDFNGNKLMYIEDVFDIDNQTEMNQYIHWLNTKSTKVIVNKCDRNIIIDPHVYKSSFEIEHIRLPCIDNSPDITTPSLVDDTSKMDNINITKSLWLIKNHLDDESMSSIVCPDNIVVDKIYVQNDEHTKQDGSIVKIDNNMYESILVFDHDRLVAEFKPLLTNITYIVYDDKYMNRQTVYFEKKSNNILIKMNYESICFIKHNLFTSAFFKIIYYLNPSNWNK